MLTEKTWIQHLRWQVLQLYYSISAKHGGPLDSVLQLSDIAGPSIGLKEIKTGRVKTQMRKI